MNSGAKMWRLVFALFKLLTTLLALALAISGIVIYSMEPLALLLPQDALVGVVAGGCLTALASFVAFIVIGVRKRTDGVNGAKIRWIVLDAVLMAGMAAAFVFSACLAFQQSTTLDQTIKQKFSLYWESASPTLLTLIQGDGQCCGFEGYRDRVLEPCKRYSEAVGCWTVLRDEYAYYLQILTPCLFILASLCSAASLLALILLVMRLKSKTEASSSQYESFRINRSQPFDAWHKTVFT